jgi:hypothetical protein
MGANSELQIPNPESSRRDFREMEHQQSLAADTEELWLWPIQDCKHLSFATARARGGRARGIRVRRHLKVFLYFAHLGGFEFEGGIAVVADVVEAAGGLAGV